MRYSLGYKSLFWFFSIFVVLGFGFEDVLAAAPPPPPAFSASCTGTSITTGSFYTSGADYYAFRLEDASTSVSPDILNNNYTFSSYSGAGIASHSYDIWMHACNIDGCSTPTHANGVIGSSFSCPAAPTCTVTTDSNYGGASCFGTCANGYSNYPTCTPPPPPPPKPEFTPTCTQTGSTWSITLSWTAVTGGADLYPVRIKSPSGMETAVDNVSGTLTSYTFSGLTQPGTYDTWMHAFRYPNNWSPYSAGTVKQVTCLATPPPTLGIPTNLKLTPNPTNENRATISWDAVDGAEYYSVRVDNNSDSWKYTNDNTSRYYTPGYSDNCNYDIVDGYILTSGVFDGTDPQGSADSCGNINRTSVEVQLVANSYNHIWVHSRDRSNGWSPGYAAAHLTQTIPPPSPSNLTASCDTSGNATVSWDPVPITGSYRHYSFRLDNNSNSWQYDVNNYRTNHDNCVNDSIDSGGVLSVPSGSGIDYCGNIKNNFWTGVINPSGTQKAWVHSKTSDVLTFGNVPQTEIIFNCSAPPSTCTVATDSNFGGPTCSGLCANGYTNYPTCTAPSTCTVATDSNFGGPTCSGLCANGYTNYPTCTPPTGSCTVATDSNFGDPTCSGICANGGFDYPTCTLPTTGVPFVTLKVNGQDTLYPAPLIINGGTPVTVSWNSWGRPYCLTKVYDFVTDKFYPGTTGTADTFIAPSPAITYAGIQMTACSTVDYGTNSVAFDKFLTDPNSKIDMQFISIPATVPPPTATLSANPTSCTIASGGSTCDIPFTWNISNASDPKLYNVTRNVQYTTSVSGTAVNYAIREGINAIEARDGTTALKTILVTASCVSGTTWTSGSCVPIPPSPCTTSPLLNCILPTPTASGNTVGGNCSVGGTVCGATCNNGIWINPTGSCTPPTTAPELWASPRLVSFGTLGTLTWDTHGTNEAACSIIGGSLGSSYTPIPASGDPFTGSLPAISIYGKTTYTINCGGLLDSATFEVTSIGFET